MEEVLSGKKKKKGKISETQERLKEAFEQLQKPKFRDLVPFQLCRLIYTTIINFPYFCIVLKQSVVLKWQESRKPPPEPEEPEPVVKVKRPKRKKLIEQLAEGGSIIDPVDEDPQFLQNYFIKEKGTSEDESEHEMKEDVVPLKWGCKWYPEEYSLLAKAMVKFPGGIPERWEKIANMLERTVPEVTVAAKRLKDSGYTLMNSTGNPDETRESSENLHQPEKEEKVRVHNDENKENNDTNIENGNTEPEEEKPPPKEVLNWNKVQQKGLEMSLKQFPKGTIDRWDRIAKCVPGKSKEDCMARYKYISETLKKKAAQQQQQME